MKEGKRMVDNSKLKNMLLLHFALFLYAAVGIFQKLSAQCLANCQTDYSLSNRSFFLALVYFAITAAIIAVYALLWQVVLKKTPLNIAYANKGICTIWTALFGFLLFQERLTPGKAIGLLIVLIGVFFVVTDNE